MNLIKRLSLGVVTTGLAGLAILIPGSAHAAQTWQAQAGSGFGNGLITTMKFYPGTITIDEGDSITWTAAGDAHTIAFLSGTTAPEPLNPANFAPSGGNSYSGTEVINSGIVNPGQSFTLTFTKAGTYQYQCLFHPQMTGTVVVQPAGTAYPHDQNYYSMSNLRERSHDIASGAHLLGSFFSVPRPVSNADGSKTYSVNVGFGNGTESIMRFSHQVTLIHVGDSVTWTNRDPMMPHTVTFPGSDGQFTDIFTPVGGSTYDGSSFTSAGILMGGQTYTLKFTKTGRFNYECLLHDEIGMKATIVVVP